MHFPVTLPARRGSASDTMRLTWAGLAYYPSIWSVFTTVVLRVSAGVSSVLKVHFPIEQRMFATHK